MTKNKLYIIGAFVFLVLLIIPLFYESTFVLHMYTLIFFYTALTAAWNIPAFGGQLSLGHASFFGIGAYTAAILYVNYGVSPWIGIVAAAAAAMVGGLVLSLPLIRLRGPFFTLASIAFAEVLRMIAIDWRSLTNGSVGINIPFKPSLMNLTFQSGMPFYYISLALAVGVVYLTYRIRSSALGFHLRAAASDDEAAKALGVNTTLTHFIALMWSSGITGVLGLFYVFYIYVLEPQTFFSLDLFSLQPALNGIIGGMGTVWGPVIGAILMTPLGEFLRFYLGTIQQGLNFVVYGLVLVLTVRFIPGGIVSLLTPMIKRKKAKKTANLPKETEVA
ncbi:MAG: branched-chain amino acid ABC transporter permease [Desulfobacteraceae bacterium]|nr:branched-chain amino acid ABC transporter permease [Desulfobacteraceae bacterium]MBC2750786.1 branched-chain amino acid ABC transporter permease [Desulfobacteraceae bacterium]